MLPLKLPSSAEVPEVRLRPAGRHGELPRHRAARRRGQGPGTARAGGGNIATCKFGAVQKACKFCRSRKNASKPSVKPLVCHDDHNEIWNEAFPSPSSAPLKRFHFTVFWSSTSNARCGASSAKKSGVTAPTPDPRCVLTRHTVFLDTCRRVRETTCFLELFGALCTSSHFASPSRPLLPHPPTPARKASRNITINIFSFDRKSLHKLWRGCQQRQVHSVRIHRYGVIFLIIFV